MMNESRPQQSTRTGPQGHEIAEPCTGCGTDVVADPVDGGLDCARCGQWQALCDDCMPRVTEHARDAVWCCPECRERPLDS